MSKVVYQVSPSVKDEATGHTENFEEFLPETTEETVDTEDDSSETITLKSASSTTIESVPVQFSDVSDNKVRFSDFYHDARSFLSKANSTKFILVSYLMLSIPVLLLCGYISEDVYREMVIILAITYLGVDVYEKKALLKNKTKLPRKE